MTDTAPVSNKVCSLLPDRCYIVQGTSELYLEAFPLSVSCKITWQHKLVGLLNLKKLHKGGLLCNDKHLHSKLTHTHIHTTSVFIMHVTAWLDQQRYATDWCLELAFTYSSGISCTRDRCGGMVTCKSYRHVSNAHWKSNTTWDKTAWGQVGVSDTSCLIILCYRLLLAYCSQLQLRTTVHMGQVGWQVMTDGYNHN